MSPTGTEPDFCRALLSAVVCAGITLLPMACSGPAHSPDAPASSNEVPDYFVGVGGRGLKGDPFATVIGTKLKLTDISEVSFSTRPEVLLGGFDSPEWRLPFTFDGPVNQYGFAWYGGGGLAYNMDDLGQTDAMVTGGINIPFSERWVLNLQINYMWQHAIDDLDGEFIATLNYGF